MFLRRLTAISSAEFGGETLASISHNEAVYNFSTCTLASWLVSWPLGHHRALRHCQRARANRREGVDRSALEAGRVMRLHAATDRRESPMLGARHSVQSESADRRCVAYIASEYNTLPQ